ncbi:MAG: SDR family oxidoreductase [Alphaproteobacteria bacterium]|nr:SDR family oxidoreductase [Alphaproteobacteria bacterium]
MSGRLDGKVALVAGAGTVEEGWSNGKATAVLFAREGAKVLAVDLNMAAAQETATIISDEGGEATAHQTDVTDEAAVETMVEACLDAYGRIDILFNNVGIQHLGGPEAITGDDWDRLMTANVKSMFLTCRHVLPVMVKQGGGSIVNNSSMAAIRFTYPSVAYMASKGAVNQLTQNIAIEYATRGVRANAVMPGLMATPRITKRLRDVHGDNYPEKLQERHDMVPIGHMGDGWDVAHAVLFLASDEAKYITGVNLPVDGGLAASLLGRAWRPE